MRRVGELPCRVYAFSTCQHGGRVFTFKPQDGHLAVTEIILGETLQCITVVTKTKLPTNEEYFIGCCSLKDGILVLSGNKDVTFACLVNAGEEKLTQRNLIIKNLRIEGETTGFKWPFLCKLSGRKALLYYNEQNCAWICDVFPTTVVISRAPFSMPTQGGFSAMPLHLSRGAVLVMGSRPISTSICRISVGECGGIEQIGSMGDKPLCLTSPTLVGGRFAVGFGGYGKSLARDMYVFDLETRRWSFLAEGGDWHPRDHSVVVVAGKGEIHVVGGIHSRDVYSIPVGVFSGLIRDARVRSAFQSAMGLPRTVGGSNYARKTAMFPALRL